ncbi:sulfotransferase family protein [Pseudorhodobacter turbinis]|uniref:Sulfotransferase family protein n=1 Tax=Pseudorhodobacter turbinis TaxID=2500533 RepID=A0A4P8EEI1_9RHOB|nr:sulfotransferase family protein [Pseudorhodobacter turbinis]QCO55139.1 sulfotransferase family protein [Pseudorhodobacter turbinis]
MLILPVQEVVVLETPKTGSLALRAMLGPYTVPQSDKAPRHIGHDAFRRKFAPDLVMGLGRLPRTVAVVRAPLERMQSWYRYRRRPQLKGLPASTHGVSFDEFMLAYLEGTHPDMANVGRQDRFVGWDGGHARVDHLFDYAQLALLERFFSGLTGDILTLPEKNKTPKKVNADYALSPEVLARFEAENNEELAMYRAVAAAGHLMRPGVGAKLSSSAH